MDLSAAKCALRKQKEPTYIIRASRLQIHSTIKQLLEHWKQSITLETPLQTGKKLEV